MNFENHIDVFKYVFQRDYKDVTVGPRGLKVGLLKWSSLSGDAQRILSAGVSKIQDPKVEEIKEKFLSADPYTGSRWISNPPITVAESFTNEYLYIFDSLIEASVDVQKLAIQEYKPLWEKLCDLFKVKEENIKSLILANILTWRLSDKNIDELIWLSRTNKEEFKEKLIPTTELSLYLNGEKRYLPGRDIHLARYFQWMFPDGE